MREIFRDMGIVCVVCAKRHGTMYGEERCQLTSMSHLAMDLLLLSLPPLFLLLYTTTKHLLHHLRHHPPTPYPTLPILGHLYFFTNPTLPFHRALSRVSRRHGPALLLQLGSRPALVVSSPAAARQCLARNDVVFASRPTLLNGKHFGYNFTSLAWAPYGDHWRNLRRLSAAHLLSARSLAAVAAVRAAEARALARKLGGIGGGEAVDMIEAFFEHAYRVVAAMIAGAAAEDGEAAAFREIVAEMAAAAAAANVVDFVPVLGWFGFGGVERKMRLVQEKRDGFMENFIGKYRRGGGNLIGILLDLQRAEPEYYTDEMIRNLILVLIQGATHTSATTLEWAFSLLLENQDNVLARARGEIDDVVGKRRLLDGSDLPRLPYLGCIINETLRMHPAAPLLTPHVSSDECRVEGFHVPRGTMLLVNAWEIHNNPETWEDPEKFVPERFEGGKVESRTEFEFEFLPFGRGRRACPGQRLAIEMVGVALGCLIQCFEWEKIGEIDMKEGKGVITPRVQPLRAKLIPRPFLTNLLA
ncbi:cytochrome P450 81Q32-like [Salvia miltiorrhiza]|uniref:cytochrome P450 81Q32-like n=1 Tax=Salvia miltiorrhiza TaxID=226208 RepID=UPI0025AB9C9A|nr:cytochrome P450 81Q32-like [Salvia miltiorrhiza]